jgi:hypothetical protein
LESEEAVGLNKELVRVGAGAGTCAGGTGEVDEAEVEGGAYASAEETADDLAAAVGSGGTGGPGVLGADFAEDEYGVSGRELELGRVRVDASEVVDSVNEARTATEGWMMGKEDV